MRLVKQVTVAIRLGLSCSLKRLSLQLCPFFDFFYFLFKSFVKVELSYVFTINMFTIAESCTEKVNYLIKQVCFLLLVSICVPPIIIDS